MDEVDDETRANEDPVESHDGVTLSDGGELGSETNPENVVLHVVRALSERQKQSPARNRVLGRDQEVAQRADEKELAREAGHHPIQVISTRRKLTKRRKLEEVPAEGRKVLHTELEAEGKHSEVAPVHN